MSSPILLVPELRDTAVTSALVGAIAKGAHFRVRQAGGPPLVSVLKMHFTALGNTGRARPPQMPGSHPVVRFWIEAGPPRRLASGLSPI